MVGERRDRWRNGQFPEFRREIVPEGRCSVVNGWVEEVEMNSDWGMGNSEVRG